MRMRVVVCVLLLLLLLNEMAVIKKEMKIEIRKTVRGKIIGEGKKKRKKVKDKSRT